LGSSAFDFAANKFDSEAEEPISEARRAAGFTRKLPAGFKTEQFVKEWTGPRKILTGWLPN
jgi:hypothetical protein